MFMQDKRVNLSIALSQCVGISEASTPVASTSPLAARFDHSGFSMASMNEE
jgi:hypothetical protein